MSKKQTLVTIMDVHTDVQEVEYLLSDYEEVEYLTEDYKSVSEETHHGLISVDSTNKYNS